MTETTLEMEDFPWKLQSQEKAPLNFPVMCKAPGGKLRVHYGRELLGSTQWLTVDEFAEYAKKKCYGPPPKKPGAILVDGRIPAYTECPYWDRCPIAESGDCAHRGINHEFPFSCASARAFKICE